MGTATCQGLSRLELASGNLEDRTLGTPTCQGLSRLGLASGNLRVKDADKNAVSEGLVCKGPEGNMDYVENGDMDHF